MAPLRKKQRAKTGGVQTRSMTRSKAKQQQQQVLSRVTTRSMAAKQQTLGGNKKAETVAVAAEVAPKPKPSRARPKKLAAAAKASTANDDRAEYNVAEDEAAEDKSAKLAPKPKRGRGRPKKPAVSAKVAEESDSDPEENISEDEAVEDKSTRGDNAEDEVSVAEADDDDGKSLEEDDESTTTADSTPEPEPKTPSKEEVDSADDTPATTPEDAPKPKGKKRAAEDDDADSPAPAAKAKKVDGGRVSVAVVPENKTVETTADAGKAAAPRTSREATSDLHSSLENRKLTSEAIPATLREVVKEVEAGVFQFTYEIAYVGIFHRLPWCVRDDVTEIVVRVAYLQSGDEKFFGVCVHLDVSECDNRHVYHMSNKEFDSATQCGKTQNFLTYCLESDLYDFLKSPKSVVNLTNIDELILKVITLDPGQHCAICEIKCNTKTWRPRTCHLDQCKATFSKWPLGVRLSPLTRDPRVLDFLLSCCLESRQAKLADYGADLLPDCPVAVGSIGAVIDSFPKLTKDNVTIEALVGTGKYSADRRKLLSWLCNYFKGCLISVPEKARVSFSDPGSSQFILMSHTPADYRHFNTQLRVFGQKHGSVAFHGTPAQNAFPILSDALRGGRRVPGVFYADEPEYSLDYMKESAIKGWSNSEFKNSMIMFGVEVAGKELPPKGWENSTLTESNVMVRYVFAIKAAMKDVLVNEYAYNAYYRDYRASSRTVKKLSPCVALPARSTIANTMQETYKAIHADTLVNSDGQ